MFQVSVTLGGWTAALVVTKEQPEATEDGSYQGPGIAAIVDSTVYDDGGFGFGG